MLKALFRYVPVVPVILAVLLFVLLPFDKAQSMGNASHEIRSVAALLR